MRLMNEHQLGNDTLFSALHALGAGDFKHLNGSLIKHLSGTANLLLQWGATTDLYRAGLYHAAYGTAGYAPSLIDLTLRQHVADLIGQSAEKIVYLYCACDRNAFWPRIGTSQQFLFADRFRQSEYIIDERQLAEFCELTFANELEIAMNSSVFVEEYGPQLSELFDRMHNIVSQAGFHAYQQVLCDTDNVIPNC